MTESVKGSGSAGDAGVSTEPREVEADLAAEKSAEIAAAQKAVDKTEQQLADQKKVLADLKKGMN